MAWSEDNLHRWFATWRRPSVLAGSRGHDAAVLRPFDGREVVCVDQCVEGVHFEPDASLRAVGRKSACRSLSDLAATASKPRALLLTISAPRERTERELRALIAGVRSTAAEFDCALVGGDLCASRGPLHLSVTAIGSLAKRGVPVGRDRARAGQRVVVTGAFGGSILGRHLNIRPRIAAGIELASCGATALMDVSDGLALDLFRIARASSVAIELDAARIPIHRDARRLARRTKRAPLDHALHDGEDHELVATLSASDLARAHGSLPGLVEIGRVVRGSGLTLFSDDEVQQAWTRTKGGFEHGR
ncbi:MAG: thiamine-phosphate kinase [Planctomycetota bacterium]|nr:thiamine-phosphate kinase [Planctomycetota bacterium]